MRYIQIISLTMISLIFSTSDAYKDDAKRAIKDKEMIKYKALNAKKLHNRLNPEDGLFYERINTEGVIATDFKELDPFTYD